MMTFDGSARELCQARRIRTNTPLQALVTLNDSVYVEAAQHFALRMKEQTGDVKSQISTGYELALGTAPSPEKLDVLLKLYESTSGKAEIKTVKANVDDQKQIDKSMVLVASAILNLDEFITKE
jgi:hypothetical protein